MVAEQSTGGRIERSRRQLSTSAANGEGEPIQEPKVKIQQQPQEQEGNQEIVQPSPEAPRRRQNEPRASTHGSAALTRSSSARSPSPASDVGSSLKSTTPPPSEQPLLPAGPVEPPVTKTTLSELDVTKIFHNPKLRHDINFDPELHFRPNLDGEKGRRKQERANLFWATLKMELSEFLGDRPSFYAKHGDSDNWTLPSLLKAVKDIIHTLIPQRDHQILDQGLNIELLMQQFHRGVADLENLAFWLSELLKTHCAPMRDRWVDTMYNQLSNGNRKLDIDELVTGMRTLLGVLEAMKLDVANHQIRSMRHLLIDDTALFEQRYFRRRIEAGKMSVVHAKQWFREAEEKHPALPSEFGDVSVFFNALSRLVLPSAAHQAVPNTFMFDEERIQKLRCDVLDLVNLEVCMRLYDDMERLMRHTVGRSTENFNFNASPLSQAASSSIALDRNQPRDKRRSVYNTLVTLLQSAPAPLPSQHANGRLTSRWEAMTPSMAVEIWRATGAPQDLLPVLEERLVALLRPDSRQYQEAEQCFLNRLKEKLRDRIVDFHGLSAFVLFEIVTGRRVLSDGNTFKQEPSGEMHYDDAHIDDVTTRLAHLGTLHWRVWSRSYATCHDGNEPPSVDDSMQV